MRKVIARANGFRMELHDREFGQPRELSPVEAALEALNKAYEKEDRQRAARVQQAYDDLGAALRELRRARGEQPWGVAQIIERERD